MSTPVSDDTDERTRSMYAPPWAREGTEELRDAPAAAGENALAASEQFRRTLPPASQLGERRTRRRETPFEGDLAIIRLRERPTLDPVAVPAPPQPERGSSVGLLARVAGAVGLAALAAFFMVGTAPLSLAVKAEGDAAPSLWTRLTSRTARLPVSEPAVPIAPAPAPPAALAAPAPAAPVPAALAERFAAAQPTETAPLPARPVQTVPVQAVPVQVAPPEPASQPRTLDRDEIATLYRRSQDLVAQGDIAGGRLLLTRAAEAGDARSALALGATYDAAVLGKLGVLGVRPNMEKARGWYAKAVEYGSGEAAKRLEQLAQSAR